MNDVSHVMSSTVVDEQVAYHSMVSSRTFTGHSTNVLPGGRDSLLHNIISMHPNTGFTLGNHIMPSHTSITMPGVGVETKMNHQNVAVPSTLSSHISNTSVQFNSSMSNPNVKHGSTDGTLDPIFYPVCNVEESDVQRSLLAPQLDASLKEAPPLSSNNESSRVNSDLKDISGNESIYTSTNPNLVSQSEISKSHEKDQTCHICQKSFTHRGNLKVHISSVHLRNSSFQCRYCDYTCYKKSNLQSHVSAVHLREKKFPCDMCSKAFTRKEHLNSHVDTVHMKLKDNTCPHCSRGFGEKGALKKHINLVHVKQRCHSCPRCGKSFGDKSNMKKHLRKLHNSPDSYNSSKYATPTIQLREEKHFCKNCNKTFSDLTSLFKHAANIHMS